MDSDDSDDDNEDDDDDDQPDDFEGNCDEETNESHQSKLDEMLRFRTRARSLKQERPRQLTPKFGNTNQRPLEQAVPQSQPQRENRQAFPCLQAGCTKICRSQGGLTLHVKRVHGAKNTKS